MSFLKAGWSPVNSVQNSINPSPAYTHQRKSEPPPTDEEMQEKMQYMINLQYAAAADQQSYPPQQGKIEVRTRPPPLPPGPVPGATITPAAAADAAAAAAAAGLSPPTSIHNATAAPPTGRSIMGGIPQKYQHYMTSGYARESAAAATTTASTTITTIDGVGQGEMYFSNDYPKQSDEQEPILNTGMPNYGGGGGGAPAAMGLHDDHSDHPDHDMEPKHAAHHHHHHRSHHHHYYHNCCCGCLCRCLQYWKNAESLRRSFCYGAIDGMLTGSGILAAFSGMGMVTSQSSATMHLFVVAFSLAACTSDAICMALGHVWGTYVLTNAGANERRTERLSFEKNRGDAKGKLVDMLLSRGMLKIDAMSIADTLEGYPDIFVSALVGDSGHSLGDESLPSSSASERGMDGTFSPLGGSLRPHRSYGQFNEWEHDPESAIVKVALNESRTEGAIMMISFALFSVLPSLIFLWLSSIMNDSPGHSGGTSVRSMTVSLTSMIMLLLGIWKSKFFDSNWIIFGIETMVVLWMCVLSAYIIGFGLVTFIPDLHGTIKLKGT